MIFLKSLVCLGNYLSSNWQ